LDADPLIGSITSEAADNRKATSVAGRNEARRAKGSDAGDPDDPRAQAANR
jgi:hypothetical protein